MLLNLLKLSCSSFGSRTHEKMINFVNAQIFPNQKQIALKYFNVLFFLFVQNTYSKKDGNKNQVKFPFFLIVFGIENIKVCLMNRWQKELLFTISTTNIFGGKLDNGYFLEGFFDNIIDHQSYKFFENNGGPLGIQKDRYIREFFGVKTTDNRCGIGFCNQNEITDQNKSNKGILAWYSNRNIIIFSHFQTNNCELSRDFISSIYLIIKNTLLLGIHELNEEDASTMNKIKFIESFVISLNLLELFNIFSRIFNTSRINFFITYSKRVISFVFRISVFRVTISIEDGKIIWKFMVLANLDIKSHLNQVGVLAQ